MRTIFYGLISRIKSFGNISVPEISTISLCEVLKIITFIDILSVQKKKQHKKPDQPTNQKKTNKPQNIKQTNKQKPYGNIS